MNSFALNGQNKQRNHCSNIKCHSAELHSSICLAFEWQIWRTTESLGQTGKKRKLSPWGVWDRLKVVLPSERTWGIETLQWEGWRKGLRRYHRLCCHPHYHSWGYSTDLGECLLLMKQQQLGPSPFGPLLQHEGEVFNAFDRQLLLQG